MHSQHKHHSRQPSPSLTRWPLPFFVGDAIVDNTQRGQFGEERYEKEEFQRTVRATFLALMEEDKVCVSSSQIIP